MWASPSTPAILFCVCAAVQSAKGLVEVEYRSEGVVINEHPFSTHHITGFIALKTAEPITVTPDDDSSTNGETILQEIILLTHRINELR